MAQAADVSRATAPTEVGINEMGGGSLLWIGLAVAFGIGLFLLLDDDDNPDSP